MSSGRFHSEAGKERDSSRPYIKKTVQVGWLHGFSILFIAITLAYRNMNFMEVPSARCRMFRPATGLAMRMPCKL